MVIFTPFSFLFLRLMQPFKKKDDGEEQPTITEQELMYMLDTIEEEGVLEEQEKELVQSALEFNDTTVEDILTPRVNMVAIDEESTPAGGTADHHRGRIFPHSRLQRDSGSHHRCSAYP